MEHAGACLYQQDNVVWYKDLFQSSWFLSLDNSNLLRGKTRWKLETCIPEMMFWSYCTCATPVTVIATPSAVSTSSHLGCNVIISREILPKNVKYLQFPGYTHPALPFASPAPGNLLHSSQVMQGRHRMQPRDHICDWRQTRHCGKKSIFR